SNANLIARDVNELHSDCLASGVYTMQFSGRDTFEDASWIYEKNYGSLSSSGKQCLFGNLGNDLSISVIANPVHAGNEFSLSAPGAFDSINNMQPLDWNTDYYSQPDTFGCSFTVLPDTFNNDCSSI